MKIELNWIELRQQQQKCTHNVCVSRNAHVCSKYKCNQILMQSTTPHIDISNSRWMQCIWLLLIHNSTVFLLWIRPAHNSIINPICACSTFSPIHLSRFVRFLLFFSIFLNQWLIFWVLRMFIIQLNNFLCRWKRSKFNFWPSSVVHCFVVRSVYCVFHLFDLHQQKSFLLKTSD